MPTRSLKSLVLITQRNLWVVWCFMLLHRPVVGGARKSKVMRSGGYLMNQSRKETLFMLCKIVNCYEH